MNELHTNRNLRLLNAYWFLRDFQLWIPVWIVFLTLEQGFSLTQVTAAEGLFLVGVVLLEVPTGAIADRYGRSVSIALGAAVLGLAILAFAFITNFGILLLSFMTWSLASTLMSGADTALLYDTLKAANRTEEFEARAGRGQALAWTGICLATLLGGPVAAATSTKLTIFVGAGTCLLTALVAISIRETKPDRTEKRDPFWASIRIAFHEIWRQPEVRALVLLSAITFSAIESLNYLVQPYLLNRGVEVGPLFSGLQVPIFLAGLGGSLLSARLVVKLGASRTILALPLISIAGCAVLALAPGLTGYAVLAMMAGVGSILTPAATGAINRRVGSERRATVLSLYGMLSSFVMAGMAPAVGYTTDRSGLGTAFFLAGLVAFVALACFGSRLFALRHRLDAPIEVLAVEA